MIVKYKSFSKILISFVLIFCFSTNKVNAIKVYDDFNNYFNVKDLGADISGHNEYVNFRKMKEKGAKFVMIKATQNCPKKDERGVIIGRQIILDTRFKENVRRAREAGLLVGFYHATWARSEREAHEEAAFIINAISPYMPFDYPISIDMEGPYYTFAKIEGGLQPRDIAVIIAKDLEDAGFFPSIYDCASEQVRYLNYQNRDSHEVGKIDRWIAWWDYFNIDDRNQVFNKLPGCTMLQHACMGEGEITRSWGVERGRLDLDISYFNFPKFMKDHSLNGYLKPSKKESRTVLKDEKNLPPPPVAAKIEDDSDKYTDESNSKNIEDDSDKYTDESDSENIEDDSDKYTDESNSENIEDDSDKYTDESDSENKDDSISFYVTSSPFDEKEDTSLKNLEKEDVPDTAKSIDFFSTLVIGSILTTSLSSLVLFKNKKRKV